jgi:hypothetical protein
MERKVRWWWRGIGTDGGRVMAGMEGEGGERREGGGGERERGGERESRGRP